MLAIKNHNIKFGNRTLIQDLNFELNHGEVLAILGRNGVGKSSFLKSIFTDNENIFWKNDSLSKFSKKELAQIFAILKHSGRPEYNITVKEYIDLGQLPYQSFFNSKDNNKDYSEYIHLLNLDSLVERRVRTLSDGEFQKIQIVRALVQNTPIILLDEPTSFLDFPSKIELYKYLKKLAKDLNKIIIFTSHDIDMAWKFACKTLILEGNGQYEYQWSKNITPEILNHFFENNHFYFDKDLGYFIK